MFLFFQKKIEITLPGVQEDLAKAIYATGKPVVVVLINGGALAIEWIKNNIPAIIEAFYPGENGAQAIAEILFGDVNPSGKLPITIFPSNYVNQISLFDMNMSDGPGRTYRYYKGTPLWPFGFGLSYTNFSITPQEKNTVAVADTNDYVTFRYLVKNIGKRGNHNHLFVKNINHFSW